MNNYVAFSIVGLLSAASLAVWAKIGMRAKRGEPLLQDEDNSPPALIHWMPLLLTLLQVSQSIFALLAVQVAPGKVEIERIQAHVLLSFFMLVLLLFPLLQNRETAVRLGFTTNRWKRQVAMGFGGFVACVLPVVLCLLATLFMREESNEHPYLQAIKGGSLEVLFWVSVSAVLIAPILEELFYRVVLQTWLQHIIDARQALLLTAAIFAAVHRLPDAIPLFPLALVLGYLYQKQRSFLTIVIIHMLFNAVNIALNLMFTD
jgi:uncharacterized protein